jgi:hypothetical protein
MEEIKPDPVIISPEPAAEKAEAVMPGDELEYITEEARQRITEEYLQELAKRMHAFAEKRRLFKKAEATRRKKRKLVKKAKRKQRKRKG